MAKILVIDDERSLRQTITAVLKYAGYDVAEAPDGFTGIQAAQADLPDLIVSDIVMPGMDGYELLERLRDNAHTATIPVIFITALAERQAMRQGMSLGADDFLVKPFAPDELLSAVHMRLRRQAAIIERHDTTLRMLRKNIIYALPHEMRTPLHLILGFAQVLEMHLEGASSADILQSVDAILKAGQRLERLIENYLVYAQLEVIATDPEEVRALRNHVTSNTAQVIRNTAQEQAERCKRSDDLLVDVHPASLRIAEESLAKIVHELVDNAFKFSSPGTPVSITATTRERHFVLSVCGRNPQRGGLYAVRPRPVRAAGAGAGAVHCPAAGRTARRQGGNRQPARPVHPRFRAAAYLNAGSASHHPLPGLLTPRMKIGR